MIIRAESTTVEVERDGSSEFIDTENPFEILRNISGMTENSRGFSGGLVGYISYQAARLFDKICLSPGTSLTSNSDSFWME